MRAEEEEAHASSEGGYGVWVLLGREGEGMLKNRVW